MRRRLIDFSRYSSIKIGSVLEVGVIEEKIALPKDSIIIGLANNLLVSDNPPPLFLLGKVFGGIMIDGERLKIGAATKSAQIDSFCRRENIGGFEYLSKLPGTLGGLIAMNAGMKEDEIFNPLLEVETAKGTLKKEEIPHGYRYAQIDDIIYGATFEIKRGYDYAKREMFDKMRYNQPKQPSAGSFFKNPPGDFAGRLIESVGLKGMRSGDAAWSEVHANFLINVGKATFDDAIKLVEEAKRRVYETHGIVLENEVQIL